MMRRLMGVSIALAVAAGTASQAQAVVVSGSLYEDFGTCTGAGGCTVPFTVLPSSTTSKLVRTTEVTCQFNGPGTVTQISLFVMDNGSNSRRFHYLSPPVRSGTVTYNQQVDYTVSGGPPRQMGLQVLLSNDTDSITANCLIVGTISTQ